MQAGKLLLAATLSFVGLKAPPSHAQSNDATAHAGNDVEEVVVTARRREERLQEVPIAVIALSGAQLERENVTRVEDVQRIAPGFVIQASPFGSAALTVTMRSQRQALPNPTYDPSVAVYFAEVIQGRSQGLNGALYDLSSVQVLKGPQGTLFGRNTPGGAVLITPQAPSPEWGGYAKVAAGDYGMFQAEAATNLPVSDMLQIRLAARHSERSGYNKVMGADYELDDEGIDAVRGSIRFLPTANLSNDLVVDYVYENDAGTGYKLQSVTPGGAVDARYGLGAQLASLQDEPFHTTPSNAPRHGTRIKALTVSNVTTFDLGNVTLKNIFGYRRLRSLLSFDLDGSSADALYATERVPLSQYSEEPQIQGKAFGDRLDYIVGAYFFRERGHDRQLTPTLGTLSNVDLDVTNKSHAAFAQATWTLPWIDTVSLTGGVRQTWDKRELTTRSKRAGVCRLRVDANGNLSDTGTIPQDPCLTSVDADFDALTYNLTADWKIRDDLFVYLAHRRGYRSGGFSNSITRFSELTPYDPEFISDFELGIKTEYGSGELLGRSNVALYTGDYSDIQRNLTVPTTEGGQTFVRSFILNAASARIRGVEIEQMLRLFDRVELNVSYAYSDAEYERFIAPDGQNYRRSPFGGAPAHTLNGSVRFDLPVREEISAQVSGYYRSSSIYADVTSFNPATQTVFPNNTVPSYHTFDARVDWDNILGTACSMSAYVRNFTDEEYVVAGQNFAALGFSAVILGPPRTVGFEVKYDF